MTSAGRAKPIIRLLSVASSCRELPRQLRCRNARGFIAFVQNAVGDRHRVTGSISQIDAPEDDMHGGRTDDKARAREIERTLADDRIVAAVALRGGAWLTRILPAINFDVLGKRRRPIALFGFSELSPLLNIAAQYDTVYSVHDYCPGFLLPGMTAHARRHYRRLGDGAVDKAQSEGFSKTWAQSRFPEAFAEFFRDVVAIIEGRGSSRGVTGRLIGSSKSIAGGITVVGGNLTTIATVLPSSFATALKPERRWLLLEDIRETPDRIDRLLAHFGIAGLIDRYDGFVLGRFLCPKGDITKAVHASLLRHLRGRRRTVIFASNVGHVWPMAPLLLNRPLDVKCQSTTGRNDTVRIALPRFQLV